MFAIFVAIGVLFFIPLITLLLDIILNSHLIILFKEKQKIQKIDKITSIAAKR
jgi:hypothetical protein